jgi:lipopolysaccharide transport system ATP-binding protein
VGAGFHPDLTGRENIYLNGTILGMSREEIGRKFDAIVEFSGLEEFIDTPIKRFSSGMFARLGFSVAVHVEPDVLVVDEVLSVGDYLFQKRGVDKMKAVLTGGTTVVFVSHNLRAVSGLCHRAMLMERGGVLAIGETSDVIRKYMERGSQAAHENTDKDAYVARVTLRSDAAEAIQFEAGAKMYADVEIVARRRVEKVAVVIECQNDEHYEVFNTSSQRLGVEPINLEAGEKFLETFELTLHLVPGTYHVGVYLHRYDIDQTYDSLVPAATFYVGSQSDVRGVAHLEPRVVQHEKRSGST